MAGPSRDERVETVFLLALARRPNEEERRWSIELLDRQAEIYTRSGSDAPDAAALVQLCHTLLNTSEFLYAE